MLYQNFQFFLLQMPSCTVEVSFELEFNVQSTFLHSVFPNSSQANAGFRGDLALDGPWGVRFRHPQTVVNQRSFFVSAEVRPGKSLFVLCVRAKNAQRYKEGLPG